MAITGKTTEVCNKLDNFMNKDPPVPSIVPTITETNPSFAVVLNNLPEYWQMKVNGRISWKKMVISA